MLVRLGTGIKQGDLLSTSINPKSPWVGNAHDRTIESLLKRSFYSKNTHKIHSMARPWGWGKECLLWLQCHTICFTHSRTSLWHGNHYNDVIMGVIASQITSLTVVYSIVHSDADQRKHQSPASLAFVRGIHQWPVNSPHKWPVTRKMFPFDDVTMISQNTPKTYRISPVRVWSVFCGLMSSWPNIDIQHLSLSHYM